MISADVTCGVSELEVAALPLAFETDDGPLVEEDAGVCLALLEILVEAVDNIID